MTREEVWSLLVVTVAQLQFIRDYRSADPSLLTSGELRDSMPELESTALAIEVPDSQDDKINIKKMSVVEPLRRLDDGWHRFNIDSPCPIAEIAAELRDKRISEYTSDIAEKKSRVMAEDNSVNSVDSQDVPF